jgi:O-antigen ligase
MDPNGRRMTASPSTDGDGLATGAPASPSRWASIAQSEVARDPFTTGLAIVMAALTLILVARGLTLSGSGGILRLTPYATLVLGPLVAALAVLRPWAGLVAWVVLMPALDIARVAVSIGDVQLILPTLVIAALAVGLWRWNARGGHLAAGEGLPTLRRTVYAGAGLMVIVTVLSTLLGTAPPARSVPIALHGLVEPALLLAIAVALRPSWRAAAALTIGMGTSVALATVFNLVRIVVVRDQLTSDAEMRVQLARLTYYNVGIYGDMLAMALPLLLGGLLMRRALRGPRWSGALFGLGLAISLVGLYMTLTKSAWLGAAAGSMALLLFLARSWRTRFAALAAAAVLVALVVPYPAYLLRAVSPSLADTYEHVTSFVNSRASTIDPSTPEGEVSVTERLYATEAALRMTLARPLLGVGPGGFAAEYEQRYRPADSTRALDSAHDLIPYVGAELGLPAAVLVALALGGGILLAWLAGRRADPADTIGRVLPMSVSAALVGFVVVSATFGVDLYRDYRMISSDVLFAALLLAVAASSWELATRSRASVAPTM